MKGSQDDTPERLLEQMGRLVVPVASPEREAALQARSAAAVDRMLERVADRRQFRRGRLSGAVLAVAAVAAAALGGSWLFANKDPARRVAPQLVALSGDVALSKASGVSTAPITVGLALAPGDQLTTASGAHASLTLANLAAVDVASETRVRITKTYSAGSSNDERLDLVQGQVSFQVPKLEPGHTLSVHTPDALVTVRGTRFSVGVERHGGANVVTLVAVSEGRVEVESHGRTLFLTRGERWSSMPDPEPVAASERAPEPPAKVTPATEPERRSAPSAREAENANTGSAAASSASSAGVGARKAESDARREAERTSTLAEENRIYEGAVASARSGNGTRALVALESLLRQYPRSPLVQSARVEHFRVLLQMGNVSGAAREARHYLSEYPAGFARDEARQIALRGLGDAD